MEVRPPEAIADYNQGEGARLVAILLRKESTPYRGSCAEDGEEVAGNKFTPNALGMILLSHTKGGGMGHGNSAHEF